MNIEKLLGKLLQEAMGSGGGHFRQPHGQHRKKQHADSLLGSIAGQLTSGKGLMTAIGLGVGAYEILRAGGQQQAQGQPGASPNWGGVPPAPGAGMSPPPPPAPPASSPAPAPPGPPPSALSQAEEEETARRLIRVMVAAAHADGALDADEEKTILERLRAAGLSQEEKMFLLEELRCPRPIAELAEGVGNLRLAQTMYAVALSAIVVDTESERQWLEAFGAALGLSPEIRRFIEETR